jgi:transcriptional regulator with XRE-family HTH domain
MKNNVQLYREKQHLTQSELAEKSGLSLRTIQRIESGNPPKGFTLKSLAQALNVEPNDLLPEDKAQDQSNALQKAKLINISALSFLLIPFGNIIVPAILTFRETHEQTRTIGKKIVTIQILWTLIMSVLLIISPFVQVMLATKIPILLMVLICSIILNAFIIIRNGFELHTRGDLFIQLKSSLL